MGVDIISDTTGKAMVGLLSRVAIAQEKQAGMNEGMSTLEQSIAAQFALKKTGKKYATRFYRCSTNTTSAGTKLEDNAGLVCQPSTDTVEGTDDYAEIPVFQWWHCNYTRDDADGFARPTCLEGWPGYHTEGAYDVGSLHMTFYWGVEEHDTYYDIILSDTEYPGLAPWVEAVKADGTVMPYWIESAYISVKASDGLLRSQPGMPTAYNQSFNSQITDYQKKGKGYWGSSIARNTYMTLMFAIKYGTKNSQSVMTGCCSYNTQSKCAVAETGVKRVLVASQGDFIVGGCVSVGVVSGTSNDRNNASMSSVADRVIVSSIETVAVDSKNYIALNLDIDTTIDTTTDTYVSTMPQWSGTTDDVIGHHDGSKTSNTDNKHVFRIGGQEYMNGQYIVCADITMEFQSNYSKNVYVAPRGKARVANARTNMELIGNIPNSGNGEDYQIGDVRFDTAHGAYHAYSIGGSSSTGTGDRLIAGGTATSGLREWLSLGYLGSGSDAGSCYVNCWSELGSAHWYYGSCD